MPIRVVYNDRPNRRACYTTETGLRIGEFYEPPLRSDFTSEELRIQDALLNPRKTLFPFGMADAAVYMGVWAVLIFLISLAK